MDDLNTFIWSLSELWFKIFLYQKLTIFMWMIEIIVWGVYIFQSTLSFISLSRYGLQHWRDLNREDYAKTIRIGYFQNRRVTTKCGTSKLFWPTLIWTIQVLLIKISVQQKMNIAEDYTIGEENWMETDDNKLGLKHADEDSW